jgi:hypothetical protein
MTSGDEKPLPEAIALATLPSSYPYGRLILAGVGPDRDPTYKSSIRKANAKPVMKTGELKTLFQFDFMGKHRPLRVLAELPSRNQVYELSGRRAIGAELFHGS